MWKEAGGRERVRERERERESLRGRGGKRSLVLIYRYVIRNHNYASEECLVTAI